jgi:hypothetical protein
MRRLLAVAVAALVVAVLLPATPGQAAYPGRNGRLVFYRSGAGFDGEVMTVRPNGFDEQQLTATPDIMDQGPVWSRDGARLAFRRIGPGCRRPVVHER